MDDKERGRIRARMNRIAGQVAGIQRMIDEDKYCMDILSQIAAVRSALDAVGTQVLTDHLESCVLGHGSGTEHPCAQPLTRQQLLEEVRTAVSRFAK